MKLRWVLVLVAAGVMAGGLVACGEETVDVDSLEEEITADENANIEAAGLDGSVEEVDCPDDIAPETGEEFECDVEYSDGTGAVAQGEVTEDGDSFEAQIVPE
jgi:hypothetical protein